MAVYTLLDLAKQVPDLSPVQYDVRNLIRAARALNNGEPFPGERLLHRVLDKTYFAHILPPLPDNPRNPGAVLEEEASWLVGKGSSALKDLQGRLDALRENLTRRGR